MNELETKRLKLRRFRLSDIGDFYEYSSSPIVGPNAGWDYHRSKGEALSVLKSHLNNDEIWAIEYKDKQKVVGSIALQKDRKRENLSVRMMGYVLNPDYWGQGLATEASLALLYYAFTYIGLSMVSVYHYPDNTRSKRVIEKCGFAYEGLLRQSTMTFNGKILDEMCYSITADEFIKSRGIKRI
ncbi:MAG: GNAT family protein [Gudongella sp.]|jgi:putative acetyltransferase|nr:GNAT family protein [Gudongella sp.]